MPKKVLFVTGKLAAPLLRETLERAKPDFDYEIAVMKITVAALMTPEWIARFLEPPPAVDLILLPGRVQGDEKVLDAHFRIPTAKGPTDLRAIRQYFSLAALRRDYGAYDIQILAEINDAARLTLEQMLDRAAYYRASGADVIDVGCTPGAAFPHLAEAVRALKAAGYRVSIDTFDKAEIRTAVAAGAERVRRADGTHLAVARGVSATAGVIPDCEAGLDARERNIVALARWSVRYIVAPILEPIGFGFAESLHRYYEVRRRFPQAEILRGTANITELTDADTTGTTALLLGFCQELGIRYILTTEDAPWARGAVREADIARRLMHYAVARRSLPKRVDPRLVTVKDPEIIAYSEAELRALHVQIKDPNYRIFTDRERIYVFNAERFVVGTDIAEIFEQL